MEHEWPKTDPSSDFSDAYYAGFLDLWISPKDDCDCPCCREASLLLFEEE